MYENSLYESEILVDIYNTPNIEELNEHTMGNKLISYVNTKFSKKQKEALDKCVFENIPIEVLGGYHGHMEVILKKYNYEYNLNDMIERRHKNTKKTFNIDRPKFIFIEDDSILKLIIFVFPSPEYIYQYAELVKAWLKYNNSSKALNIPSTICKIYPILNQELYKWTKLNDVLNHDIKISKGDILVIGYIDFYTKILRDEGFARVYTKDYKFFGIDNCYGINFYRHPKTKRRCIVLGVKYSFWGSASARIVKFFIEQGVDKVIYIAKAGTRIAGNLEKKQLIHNVRLITGPFYIWEYDDYDNHSKGRLSPQYNTKTSMESYCTLSSALSKTTTHISVPSVVSETRKQEIDYNNCNPSTIDNEISFIAKTVQEWNENENETVEFSSVHYITDYVTSFHTSHLSMEKGLEDDNMEIKKDALNKAYRVVANYIQDNGILDQSKEYTTELLISSKNDLKKQTIDWLEPNEEYQHLLTSKEERNDVLHIFLEDLNTLSQLYKALNDKAKTVLISGEIGSGKSLFLSALYYDFLQKHKDGTTFKPIYINLSLMEKQLILKKLTYEQIELTIKEINSQNNSIILMIDGLDEYAEISRFLYENYIIKLNGYNKVVSNRTYPFEKWDIQNYNESRLIRVIHLNIRIKKFHLNEKENITDMLRKTVHNISEANIKKVLKTYRRVFGSDSVNCRLISLLTKEEFLIRPPLSGADFFYRFINQYMTDKIINWEVDNDNFFRLSKTAFRLLMEWRCETRLRAGLGFKKRILTQSEEMIYYLSAHYICKSIILYDENTSDDSFLERLNHTYHNKINKYAKELINLSVETQNRYMSAIERNYDNSGIYLKSFMIYLCGRFENTLVQKNSKKFLKRIKNEIKIDDYNGNELVLNRTIYISLIYLGENSDEYIQLMRTYPKWDAVNRGFHLSYYEDKDYFYNPNMIMIDNGEAFKNTYANIVTRIYNDSEVNSLDLSCFTLYSLALNRAYNGTLHHTIDSNKLIELKNIILKKYKTSRKINDFIEYVCSVIQNDIKPFQQIIEQIYAMKIKKRTGWNLSYNENINRKVESPESIADHTYSAMMIALIFLPETDEQEKIKNYEQYDKNKIIRMLLVHDFPESETGDIPSFLKTEQDKERESSIISKLTIVGLIDLESYSIGNLYKNIEVPWEKFERKRGVCINAEIAQDIDKIECYGQLLSYLELPTTSIEDAHLFKENLRQNIFTEIGKNILNIIEKKGFQE